jgi:hypothetical protein
VPFEAVEGDESVVRAVPVLGNLVVNVTASFAPATWACLVACEDTNLRIRGSSMVLTVCLVSGFVTVVFSDSLEG